MVGNDDAAAALELVLRGAALTADGPTRVAVAGASWRVDDTVVDPSIAHEVADGATIEVGPAYGAYSYVAVAGGIDVPPVMGSRSTDTLSGIGPNVLAHGDVLPIGDATGTVVRDIPRMRPGGPLGVLLGPRDDWFTD